MTGPAGRAVDASESSASTASSLREEDTRHPPLRGGDLRWDVTRRRRPRAGGCHMSCEASSARWIFRPSTVRREAAVDPRLQARAAAAARPPRRAPSGWTSAPAGLRLTRSMYINRVVSQKMSRFLLTWVGGGAVVGSTSPHGRACRSLRCDGNRLKQETARWRPSRTGCGWERPG